jgi:hypothetical protein
VAKGRADNKKRKSRKGVEACTIPPAIPLEALRHFVIEPDETTAVSIGVQSRPT